MTYIAWQWNAWIQRRGGGGSTGTSGGDIHTAIERGIAYALYDMGRHIEARTEVEIVLSASCPMCKDSGRIGQTARSKGRACACQRAKRPDPMTIVLGEDHYCMLEQGRSVGP